MKMVNFKCDQNHKELLYRLKNPDNATVEYLLDLKK